MLPSVYSIGEPTGLARCAAILAWEPTATFSHRTAAWWWHMLPAPTVFEATVRPDLSKRQPDWIRLYRRRLDTHDVLETWGMPTVSPEQALIDCLAVMSPAEADLLVDAQLTESVSAEGLRLLHKKYPGRRGNRDIERQIRSAALDTASEPERLLARAFARRNFTISANVPIGPYIADFHDERARLVVEVDGREFHSEPGVFRSDRRRQNWMVRRGLMVLRYAAADVFETPDAVADEVIVVARRRRKTLA
ncbi:MAG: DUF559 domain-containing protein [Aldersonia sp.]|nr:DUF559 domain-containing protein [Aldersonia sp.]